MPPPCNARFGTGPEGGSGGIHQPGREPAARVKDGSPRPCLSGRGSSTAHRLRQRAPLPTGKRAFGKLQLQEGCAQRRFPRHPFSVSLPVRALLQCRQRAKNASVQNRALPEAKADSNSVFPLGVEIRRDMPTLGW